MTIKEYDDAIMAAIDRDDMDEAHRLINEKLDMVINECQKQHDEISKESSERISDMIQTSLNMRLEQVSQITMNDFIIGGI